MKPCPFCGRDPTRNGRTGVGGVLCRDATHFLQVYGKTQAEADENWNSRRPAQDYEQGLEDAARISELHDSRGDIAEAIRAISKSVIPFASDPARLREEAASLDRRAEEADRSGDPFLGNRHRGWARALRGRAGNIEGAK